MSPFQFVIIGESARISAVQAQIKSYTYMSAESALAGYGRQVYEDNSTFSRIWIASQSNHKFIVFFFYMKNIF